MASGKGKFNGAFYSPSKGVLRADEVVRELVVFMAEDAGREYRLVIGTDSKEKLVDSKKAVDFVSAVVIHRQGHGGRYFWKRTRSFDKKIRVLRNKIYE